LNYWRCCPMTPHKLYAERNWEYPTSTIDKRVFFKYLFKCKGFGFFILRGAKWKDDFTIIKFKIYLTWQPSIVISEILTEVGYSQYTWNRMIFGFLSRYLKFWFGKISSDFSPIYKIPKFHIASAHPTNFWLSQISSSGTISTIWGWSKFVVLSVSLLNQWIKPLEFPL